MKILCAYHDDEIDYLGTDPEIELAGHEIVTVHSYAETIKLITDSSVRIPPFDVVLLDIVLPYGLDLSGKKTPMMLTPLLFIQTDENLIRGMGVFVPKDHREGFSSNIDSYHALVADNTCWTPSGKRDWRKLLELVLKEINQIVV